ncbi:MAG: bifunctional pyr operon transcriptional regulator/uracil phosphoribosyltransferase PyrR [Acidobacteriota bacterium]
MKKTDDLALKRRVLDADEMRRIIRRMAGEIVEHLKHFDETLLVGIRTRGLPLAERLVDEIHRMEGVRPPLGALDITFYRDDLSRIGPQPVVVGTDLAGNTIDGKVVILCDDVLYTGRTVRAALDELQDYGRPQAVRLAVLVDRGHRELPIQADVVGRSLQTTDSELVEVGFTDTDGEDFVRLLERGAPPPAAERANDGDDA